MYENWQNRELWRKHMENQHLADYIAATNGAVVEFVVHEMTQISQ